MTSADAQVRRRVVQAALDADIDFFDTAAAYGDGESEINLGSTLADLGSAPDVFTKVAITRNALDSIRESVVQSVEASLDRLGHARVSGVTLHNRIGNERSHQDVGMGPLLTPRDVLGPGGVVEGLDELRQMGKIRWFGFTTLGGDRRAIEQVMDSGRFHYINAIHSVLGPLDSGMPPIRGAGPDYDVIEEAVTRGIAVLGVRVLGGATLLDPPKGLRAAVDDLDELGESLGMPLTDLALRYALTDPTVTSDIIGFTEVDHVEHATAARALGRLDPEVIERIAHIQRTSTDAGNTRSVTS